VPRRSNAGPWTVRLEITPGLEDVLAAEIEELGVKVATRDTGGVEARMDAKTLLHVQRWSRVASRATIRLARVQAPSLEGLAERVRKLPWGLYAVPRQPVQVDVSSTRSKLRHRKTVAAKVEHAIADALRGPRRPSGRPPREPLRVGVRIENDVATIRVDASGELLHKRGWRKDPGRAPLRENLAVAVLRAADWRPGEALADPMTGSGTFAVEAALWSLGRAPGSHRPFACEHWASWPSPKPPPGPRSSDPGTLILAADRDQRSLDRARKNASRARVDARIQLEHTALCDLRPPAPTGLVVMNPPWGDRLGDPGHARSLHTRWREHLHDAWPAWRVAVLVPDEPWAASVWRAQARVAARFRSGGTAVCVWVHEPT